MTQAASDYAAFVIQAGAPGALDEAHARETADATVIARQNFPKAQISWWVDGYDDDPRELWQIPEVAAQIRRCARLVGWVDGFTLPREALAPHLIVLLVKCNCFPNGHPFVVVGPP